MEKLRKNLRIKGYDYSQNGYYFVTIVTHNRLPLLKKYKGECESVIKDLPKFIEGLKIDYFIVMDNHIHVIFVFDGCERTLGQVVRSMKYNITKIVTVGLSSHNKKCSSGRFDNHQICSGGIAIPQMANSDSLTNLSHSNATATIWQWNYYEHIIRSEKELEKIREYIENNPLVEKLEWSKFENKD